MKIVLLHVPPSKISSPADKPGGDFTVIPYGLLTISAQAINKGHKVLTLNISNYYWSDVESLIRQLEADIFGISCLTLNRHGVAAVAELIRQHHNDCHIVVGGPHVSALPAQTLKHWQQIDSVIIGEGEDSFIDLVGVLAKGQPVLNIPGVATRKDGEIIIGPKRPRISDIDSIPAPPHYFSTATLLTSRGCPGRCTFCGSNMMWGKRLTYNSAEYTLDMFEKAVKKHNRLVLSIKDDTFTSNRRRVLDICNGIKERGLNFLWSCDSRVDSLDEEVLQAMREAGCQLISFGVESASADILRSIKKGITTEKVREATRLAQKLGILVRYYMIVGNRGENLETFMQGLQLIDEEKPHDFSYHVLSYFPGTEEFDILEQKGVVGSNVFFSNACRELSIFGDNTSEEKSIIKILNDRLRNHVPIQQGLKELLSVLEVFPELHAAHLDVGGAYLRSGEVDKAECHVRRALDLHYPLPGFVFNYFAGISALRGDFKATIAHLEKALSLYPHPVVLRNRDSFYKWQADKGPEKSLPLQLEMTHQFEYFRMSQQPELPGTIRLNLENGHKVVDLGEKIDPSLENFPWYPNRLDIHSPFVR